MRELEYPFDAGTILKKRVRIKRELLESGGPFLEKKIAVLGSSTTHDICKMLELFLLNVGIKPTFYQSEYGQYWQDAMFPPQALASFAPDVLFVHTSLRNLQSTPTLQSTPQQCEELLLQEFARFEQMWDALRRNFSCPIIQNNFEPPFYRLLGNRDGWDARGLSSFAAKMNGLFAGYAAAHDDFFLHDIAFLAAEYGLSRWSEPSFWHMYKYCLALPAIPAFAANLSHIIASLFGRGKKVLALDLDNTLWGGVVGDDGVDGIEIGHETAMGEVYSEFQSYAKQHRGLGVLLVVASKNDEENALAGLNHPESTLHPEDFAAIRANWDPKDRNLADMAAQLNLGADSFVFVDDNPAERELVRQSGLDAAVPELDKVQHYIDVIDKNGYFETTHFSADDAARAQMYAQNAQRQAQQASFADYDEYLRSLAMRAVIRPFEKLYLPRIAQLTNKSNQFNLTTRRLTEGELATMAADGAYICLYGKLEDKFGDNGVVSVVAARKENQTLHIELWLMSCRVLKRGMEDAMMDTLVARAQKAGMDEVKGYYYATPKNGMVKDFYARFDFEKVSEDAGGNTEWLLCIKDYQTKKPWIEVDCDDA